MEPHKRGRRKLYIERGVEMETIKNYLESMFRGLPLTDKVMKAKSELLQMMEDKYTELIRSGKTENEAVGEVIQNFGNLEDLAEDLGIMDILHATKYSEVERRKVSFEEVVEYLSAKKHSLVLKCLGLFFCIICPSCPITTDTLDMNDIVGVTAMFVLVAIGVVLMCLSSATTEQWRFLKTEPCSIDAVSIDYLKNKLRDFTPTYSILSSVGVLLCVFCFVPPMIFDELILRKGGEFGAVFLFVFIGAGVFMMVYAKQTKKAYHRLLNLNDQIDFEEDEKRSIEKIQNKNVRAIMSAYWSVVTCIYLCVSFLTFRWELTWLIWPIAAAVNTIIRAIYTVNDGEKKTEKTSEKNVEKIYEE